MTWAVVAAAPSADVRSMPKVLADGLIKLANKSDKQRAKLALLPDFGGEKAGAPQWPHLRPDEEHRQTRRRDLFNAPAYWATAIEKAKKAVIEFEKKGSKDFKDAHKEGFISGLVSAGAPKAGDREPVASSSSSSSSTGKCKRASPLKGKLSGYKPVVAGVSARAQAAGWYDCECKRLRLADDVPSIDVEVIEQLGGHDCIKAMKPTAAQYGSNTKTLSLGIAFPGGAKDVLGGMAFCVMKTIREQYTAPLHKKGLPTNDKVTKSNAVSKLELWIDANGYTETCKKRSVMAYKALCCIHDGLKPTSEAKDNPVQAKALVHWAPKVIRKLERQVPKKVRVNVGKGALEKQIMDALEELGMGIPAGLCGKKLITRFRNDMSRYLDKVPTCDAKGEFMMNEGDKFTIYKGIKKAGMNHRAYTSTGLSDTLARARTRTVCSSRRPVKSEYVSKR
ncbi:uncharacterized protein ACA1_301400 [Acanthamoeba castellanii str. Neff]|uniref:Uncharacterized protein n=1 Tax=Acanthamoeba castellanii (strain ATCC 30010 / Neff) TaxID=1257118 RepID=L8GKA0_ACACF|nr:uncharacterized protein ACA1_301400 [Acanthamoeba castellanii str. Neff]ELR13138.1 hypothetical protein ACA1_301400 [Acanthamoeba castellanii str. Neff]